MDSGEDADGDGKAEFIVANGFPDRMLSVFESYIVNQGLNKYGQVWDSGNTIGWDVFDVCIGDQDSDGILEIIAVSEFDHKIWVFENNGDNLDFRLSDRFQRLPRAAHPGHLNHRTHRCLFRLDWKNRQLEVYWDEPKENSRPVRQPAGNDWQSWYRFVGKSGWPWP